MTLKFVCLSVCPSSPAWTVKFGAKGGHYLSEGFVCLSVISRACADNRADAVDRLLILETMPPLDD